MCGEGVKGLSARTVDGAYASRFTPINASSVRGRFAQQQRACMMEPIRATNLTMVTMWLGTTSTHFCAFLWGSASKAILQNKILRSCWPLSVDTVTRLIAQFLDINPLTSRLLEGEAGGGFAQNPIGQVMPRCHLTKHNHGLKRLLLTRSTVPTVHAVFACSRHRVQHAASSGPQGGRNGQAVTNSM